MGRLLHFELHKLVRRKSFYICTLIVISIVFATTYTTILIGKNAGAEEPYVTGTEKMLSAVGTGLLSTVIGVFIPLFVCEDFTGGTIRSVITRGYSRGGIYFSKLIAALLACVVMAAVCMAAGYGAGTLLGGDAGGEITREHVNLLLSQLAVVAAYCALFFAISYLIKKTGGAIAVCVLLPNILTILLALVDTKLAEQDKSISGYWLDDLITQLSATGVAADDIRKALLIALAYFSASIIISCLATSKREY